MTTAMDKQSRRAQKILRQFGQYVEEAATEAEKERALRDTPTIARTKPRTFARIKRSVAWRLMAKGRK